MKNDFCPVSPEELYLALLAQYGDPGWWPAESAVEMMTGAVLTQNTAWSNVERAIAAFGGRLDARFILDAPHDELAAIIRPAGYYNIKAKRLKALMGWFGKYGFDVTAADGVSTDALRGELLAISGIGGETADSILVYAFGRTSFVIDAYTRRLMARLGHTLPEGYDPQRLWFEERLPRDIGIYNRFHALIVEHCKRFCVKTAPRCAECPLGGRCPRAGLGDGTII